MKGKELIEKPGKASMFKALAEKPLIYATSFLC